jgi:YHS domain-containing protein
MPTLYSLKTPTALILAFGLALALLAAPVFAGEQDGQTTPVLTKVETKKVCMVNNQLFEKDQIPVEVEGRTYYGCCEMCKERLANDANFRLADDPVTGKEVDKAKAVIAALPDGSVLYFESDATLERYKAGERRK